MNDRNFIRHRLGAIDRIESNTGYCSEADFMSNFIIQSAVMRNHEIIGEASKRLSIETKSKTSSIPWKQIAGMRDKRINHFGVDLFAVWSVVTDDLRELKNHLIKHIE